MLRYELFFGQSHLTGQEWADFTAQVVTPHLPDGFTVIDADGQWTNPVTRTIARNRTKVLLVAIPDTAAGQAAIGAIKDEYRVRFQQLSVGTIVHPVCAAF